MGTLVEHLANGRVLARIRHENGRPNGPSQAWWPSGAKRSDGAHKDGLRDGDWFEFQPDGTLDRARTGLYRDGLRIAGIRGFNDWLGSP
jgi:antitoxin component YwqK of YwqJK toxin-antitoxin module